MKNQTPNQLIGQRGELLAAERAMAMGLAFHVQSRLEAGIDGMLELRDQSTGRMLCQWIGAQVKTTESGRYPNEDEAGFEYLLRPADLAYWRGSNIPVIIVLVRLDAGDMYWKPVAAGNSDEPRRLRFDNVADRFDRRAADRVAASCISREKLGTYVPPMLSGENIHINMVRIVPPEKIYVAASLFASGREAVRELAMFEGQAPFDWVIRKRRFISFRNPESTPLVEVLDEGSMEPVETTAISLSDDADDENAFIELLGRTLRTQVDDLLSFDRDSRALYFRAERPNSERTYRYQSLVNETEADVVSVWRRKGQPGRQRSPSARNAEAVPYAVGLYITAAYWFTASTSFANPAVTLARALSDTFAGIAPGGVLAFIVAQLIGMLAAVAVSRWLWEIERSRQDP
jgi:hypothetical protein